jgi:hypothetical protein
VLGLSTPKAKSYHLRPLSLIGDIVNLISALSRHPRTGLRLLRRIPLVLRGLEGSSHWPSAAPASISPPNQSSFPRDENPLAAYFKAHSHGRGIWKWIHYFEAYHRHFQKFIGQEVHVLEIGIYSGGSLEMWRNYFGAQCRLYGVDIQPACKAHENEFTKVFIGDQADRHFWRAFKREVPVVDILIDDGGHTPEQQVVTLEEMLPHLRPGGVYFCEDVHGPLHGFGSFLHGLADGLNSYVPPPPGSDPDALRELISPPTPFQSDIHSIHSYPFATVIEKRQPPVEVFRASKHGSEWDTLK